jgi:hypothetical protein
VLVSVEAARVSAGLHHSQLSRQITPTRCDIAYRLLRGPTLHATGAWSPLNLQQHARTPQGKRWQPVESAESASTSVSNRSRQRLRLDSVRRCWMGSRSVCHLCFQGQSLMHDVESVRAILSGYKKSSSAWCSHAVRTRRCETISRTRWFNVQLRFDHVAQRKTFQPIHRNRHAARALPCRVASSME